MKIEHKLVLDDGGFGIFGDFKDGIISFCKTEFKFYFKFGNRKTVFFMVSDRKPRHGEAFKLIESISASRYWKFADLDDEEHPEEDDSPWPIPFDLYLNRTFDTAKPVYIWVEYE